MIRDICFKGNFGLRYKNYLGNHKYTTHDIEIVKWAVDKEGRKYCYTVASWNDTKEPDLVSCGNRLVTEINSMEDLEDINMLVDIGYKILETEKTPITLPEPEIKVISRTQM